MRDEDAVVVVVTFEPLPYRRAELVAAVERGVRKVQRVRGCLLYSLQYDDTGPLRLVEKWASREDLAAFLDGPVAVELLESYEGLLAAAPVPRVMRPREVGLPSLDEQ